jgi:hypothetical protein
MGYAGFLSFARRRMREKPTPACAGVGLGRFFLRFPYQPKLAEIRKTHTHTQTL